MTLRQLIQCLEYVGRCVTNADIPVKVNDNDVDLLVGLDNTLDENGVATGLCVNIKLQFPLCQSTTET